MFDRLGRDFMPARGERKDFLAQAPGHGRYQPVINTLVNGIDASVVWRGHYHLLQENKKCVRLP